MDDLKDKISEQNTKIALLEQGMENHIRTDEEWKSIHIKLHDKRETRNLTLTIAVIIIGITFVADYILTAIT